MREHRASESCYEPLFILCLLLLHAESRLQDLRGLLEGSRQETSVGFFSVYGSLAIATMFALEV
jgi:hypothetical protein